MQREERSALVSVLKNRIIEIDSAIDLATDMITRDDYAGCIANEEVQINKMLTLKSEREKVMKTLNWLSSDQGGQCIVCKADIHFETLVSDHRIRLCHRCTSIIN